MATAIFLGAAAALVYTYAGYPLVLWIWLGLVRLRSRWWRRGQPTRAGVSSSVSEAEGERTRDLPFVSVIVAAHNEEGQIRLRARNLLAQDYPRERLEVIVGSDGSTDGTIAAAGGLGDPRVRVLDLPRSGRATVHNACVAAARGEVVVFTDAATEFAPDCLRRLVGALADPSVGCVSGHLVYRNAAAGGIARHAGWYWRYELALRRLESATGSTVAATGACMAMRKHLFRPLAAADDVDDGGPVDVLLAHRRVLFVPQAIAFDRLPSSSEGELAARRRIVTKNLFAIVSRPRILSPCTSAGAAFKLFSHRVLRYLSPVFLVLLLAANGLLLGHPVLQLTGAVQLLFYTGAALGFVADRMDWKVPVVAALFAFCLANVGFLLGVWNTVTGRGITLYEPMR